MRNALFERVNALSYAEIDRFGTPSLITRITNDVNQVQLAIALGVRQLTRWPLLSVGSMIAAMAIDAKLSIIFFISMPLIGGIFWFVMARCVPHFKRMQQKLDRISLLTREGLSGARVVRAFVREDHERERFRHAADEQADIAIVVGKLSCVLNPATFLVMNLAVCAILWVGGLQVNVGALTQGEVMAFVNYMTQTLLSIVYVANLVVVFTKAGASAGRILEVLDCEPGIRSGADAATEPDEHAEFAIALRDACFAYPGSTVNAVDHVTLELPWGGTLGIIGGTGSGKSTLVSLVPRLHEVTGGSVEVLGRDVRAWDLDALRRQVGFVPQKAELVSGTIRSNLTWRDPSATDADLWSALETAQAREFVAALPLGLDAPVEAGGKNFSGGQRQRLTIARALVGSPRIIIMDDSASALDFKTDASLRAAIRGLTCAKGVQGGDPTTVIVSQRVSSVRDADLICVMRHGSAVGVGTHEELMSSCDIYREICASQLGAGEGVTSHA
ncbi:putative ABC transporter ATP-binding protein [Collinsella intestinalis]|nr:putative ABC transporter ATP-binding protein [Collinsella intestinalis]